MLGNSDDKFMGFLMTSQRAMLHQILETNQFKTNDFEIVPSKSRTQEGNVQGDSLLLRGTEFYFGIYPHRPRYISAMDSTGGSFLIEYSPGMEQLHEYQVGLDWQAVVFGFVQYLGTCLARELQSTDPWKEAEAFAESLNAIPETEEANAPVSDLERKAIWKALVKIQATLLEHVQGSTEKQEYVVNQIKVLKDAAEHFGRKDYLNLLYTTIIGIATAVGVPQSVWQPLLHSLSATVTHILHLL